MGAADVVRDKFSFKRDWVLLLLRHRRVRFATGTCNSPFSLFVPHTAERSECALGRPAIIRPESRHPLTMPPVGDA